MNIETGHIYHNGKKSKRKVLKVQRNIVDYVKSNANSKDGWSKMQYWDHLHDFQTWAKGEVTY